MAFNKNFDCFVGGNKYVDPVTTQNVYNLTSIRAMEVMYMYILQFRLKKSRVIGKCPSVAITQRVYNLGSRNLTWVTVHTDLFDKIIVTMSTECAKL